MRVFSKIAYLSIALGAVLASTSASALQTPERSMQDHRIQHVKYSSQNVTRLNAANGFISTVVFAPDEKVLNYGSGYSTAWEFATADNQFFLKPKDKEGTTNLVVVTNKRIYSFDVFLVEKSQNATYKLTFSYPEDEAAKNDEQLKKNQLKDALNAPDPNVRTNPHLKNCYYKMNFGETKGSKHIAPVTAFDDGLFTYFKFKPNTDFPAVYAVSSDGEAIINSHIENDTLVIHGVYPEYRLRAGSDVVGIYNEGFNKQVGKASLRHNEAIQKNTTVKGVTRHLKVQEDE